ncbi:MAG TPA: zinc dependent phospholipase C family protein [Terriglobales bacterium]|nr:zinc dependent phospholipase C family protein [Terriglobales bacterium]
MQPTRQAIAKVAVFLLLFVFVCSGVGNGYSVLTHEEMIDLLWKDQLRPLLLKRFPQASDEDMKQAHAYAYGGSLVQDMGYYPFGSKYFSDLVHYLRTGDFVLALIQDSSDLNEYAFALGALAHYAADNSGHPTINHVVALSFPKLRRKYGEEVTYADDPKAHIRTEFGFDMVQVAKNRYTSDTFHDFIGFNVSKPLLERAFAQTYGLELKDVIPNEDLAIGTFRRAISKIIPEMTRVALLSRRKEIVRDTPNFNEKEFLYHLSRAKYQREWGNGYRKPGAGTRVLAFFLKIVPKVGPFKALAFKIPTTQTEDMYIKSINKTVDDYGALLREQKAGQLTIADLDFDTGRETRAGEYSLADKTYAHLLDDLAKHNFAQASPQLRQNILSFYADGNAPIATKKNAKAWRITKEELDKLKAGNADHSVDTASTLAPTHKSLE